MSGLQQQFDVVVVGAGPAGSSAALAASQDGARVLILDYKQYMGVPVQCAEYVPQQINGLVQMLPGAIVQRIDRMLTYINGELCSSLAAPGYILDRSIFDRQLVEQALAQGAELWLGAKAVERTSGGMKILYEGSLQEIQCHYIIGADGPRSTVGKWMNSTNQDYMVAMQWTLALCKQREATEIYFSPEFTGGYAWLFPRGCAANLGVGVLLGEHKRLPSLFADFIKKMIEKGIVEYQAPLRRTGGLVPTGGPLTVTAHEGMLLAGDAAGQTHPISGGGIMNAILCGRLAGQTVAQTLHENNPARLAEYTRKWQERLSRQLAHATRQRIVMDQGWTSAPQAFESLIRQSWLAFD